MAWPCAAPALSEAQFDAWRRLLEARTGVDLSQRRSLLESGLRRRLRELGGADYDNYFEQVSRPEGRTEWLTLVDRLIVKETRFFRQPEAFELVAEFLCGRARSASSLELWSVGCATGEEAYSLAMVGDDAISRAGATCFLGVLATDLCGEALRRGRAGRFEAQRLEPVPEDWRGRYFETAGGDSYRIRPALRRRVCWSRINLLEARTLPPLAMDVIFCQNVLIYFRRWRVRQVLDALAARLKPGGLLVLGPGEATHWRHPTLARCARPGVSAFLRRIEN